MPDDEFNENFFEPWLYAPATKDMYDRSWRYWNKFLASEKLVNPAVKNEASDPLFKRYALWRLNHARKCHKNLPKAATINVELSAINAQLHDKGLGINRLTNGVGTRHLIKGIERYETEVLGYTGDQTRAFLDVMLDSVVVMLPRLMDRGILLTMKHAGLRSDNVVFNHTWHHLKVADCWFLPTISNFKQVMCVLPALKLTNSVSLSHVYFPVVVTLNVQHVARLTLCMKFAKTGNLKGKSPCLP